MLVLRPPHRPLSVVTRIAPTRLTVSRFARKGCLYSVLALATCSAICSARSTYGRDARMRSWAFFIFEAATISIALVILRVLCTLLILFRISFDPAISFPHCGPRDAAAHPVPLAAQPVSTRRSS